MTASSIAAPVSGGTWRGEQFPVAVEGAATNRGLPDRPVPATAHPSGPSPAPRPQQRGAS